MKKPVKCNREGCENTATAQVGFKVWAQGYPKSSTPLTGLLGLAVCDEHQDIDPKTFFVPESIALINNQLLLMGRLPADFTRAEIVYETIIDGALVDLRKAATHREGER